MKTKLFIALLLIAAIIATAGCSKSNNNDPGPGDKYGELFRSKTWSGEFKYANKPVTEPFNMTFKEDGTFIWREYSGTYNGKYTIDKNTGTITFGFDATASQVSAKIALEGKLTDFTFSQSNWKIIHSEINNAEIEQVIEGTTWKGTITDRSGSSLPAHFNFLRNGRIYIPAGGAGLNWESTSYYSRESGTLRFEYDGTDGSVRIAGRLFFVFMADGSLKGYEYKQLWTGGSPTVFHNVFSILKQSS